MIKNVETTVDGDTLVITVDLTKSFGRTAKGEGKNVAIASTGGGGGCGVEYKGTDINIGLNVTRKPTSGE